MKFVMALTLCFFSLNSWSNKDHKKEMEKMMDSMSYEDAKKMKLEMLDHKSAMIEEARTCINGTKDKNGLKDCMKMMHEKKKEMKEMMKGKMKKK